MSRSRYRSGAGGAAALGFGMAGAALDLDFGLDRYLVGSTGYTAASAVMADGVWSPAYSRALAALKQNPSGGAFDNFASGVLRRHPNGALLEAAAVNRVRTGAGTGAVNGSPGTGPTNWAIPTVSNGLSRQIVDAAAVRGGVQGIAVRYSGTASAGGTIFVSFDSNTYAGYAALQNQTWTFSTVLALDAGALPSGARTLSLGESDSGGTQLGTSTTTSFSGLGATATRFSVTRTLPSVGTAFVRPFMAIAYANAEAVDFTLFIGGVQVEQAPAASSPIITTGAELTRPRDVTVASASAVGLRADQGFMVARVTPDAVINGQVLASLSDAPGNNRVVFRQAPASAALSVEWTSGGAVQRTVTSTYTLVAGADITIAAAWNATSTWAKLHTDTAATGAALTVPASVTSLAVASRSDGTDPANGVYRRIIAGAVRPSDADMANIFAAVAA